MYYYYYVLKLCMLNTWFKRGQKRKVILRMGENETKNDIVLKKKGHGWSMQNEKAILGEFQQALVTEDRNKKKIRKVVKMHVLREER